VARLMSVLSGSELVQLALTHLVDVARIVAAAGLSESGGRTDATGDSGHSIGLWQMHDQGLGSGMTVAQRSDPNQAAAVMVPVFLRWYAQGVAQGYTGEELARYTCMYTERPEGFPDLYCTAANAYAQRWNDLAGVVPTTSSTGSADLAAERAWGTALLVEVGKWADTIQEVVNTMKRNANGE
jgi:hypothetical protein